MSSVPSSVGLIRSWSSSVVFAGSRRTLIWRLVAQRLLNATSSSSSSGGGGGGGGDAWTREEFQPASRLLPTVVYGYRAVCDADLHGPGCTEFCRPRNDSFGHYDCDVATGRKLCHARWTGTFCHTRTLRSPVTSIYLYTHRVLLCGRPHFGSVQSVSLSRTGS